MLKVLRKTWDGIKNRHIIVHVLLAIIVAVLLILCLNLLLKVYTKHGNQVEMQDYSGLSIEDAEKMARDNNFELIINDSVYLLNRIGGEIIGQSPSAGSLVKSGRKVYLTITKRTAEEIKSGLFPDMYGKSYENVKVLLERRFKLKSNVKAYTFDPGPKEVILEAYYKDQLLVNKDMQNQDIKIPKGESIDFVLSQREKGPIAVPGLRCLKYEAINFVLNSNELKLGKVYTDSTVGSDTLGSYVVRQEPGVNTESISIGEKIDVYLSKNKPVDCQ